jgi:hypothetical protein
MPGGSVTRIGRTYKKWTYISRKNSISHKISQHRIQGTINRIQGTKHKKKTAEETTEYTETTKHENKEKATAWN